MTFDNFLKIHPELKTAQTELQQKRYNIYEEKRKKYIEEAKSKRKNIINLKKYDKKLKKSLSQTYMLEHESYLLFKEEEKIKYLKNQTLAELKNIINYEFKLEEIKKKIEEKRLFKGKKENQEKIKQELKKEEKEKSEQEEISRKTQERPFWHKEHENIIDLIEQKKKRVNEKKIKEEEFKKRIEYLDNLYQKNLEEKEKEFKKKG